MSSGRGDLKDTSVGDIHRLARLDGELSASESVTVRIKSGKLDVSLTDSGKALGKYPAHIERSRFVLEAKLAREIHVNLYLSLGSDLWSRTKGELSF